MDNLKEQEIKKLMDDLYNVGKTKMLGYLPLVTVIENCGLNIFEVKENLNSKGLFVKFLLPEECSIFSGAIYVAQLDRLQEFLLEPEQKKILQRAKWPSDATLFIDKVANEHANEGTHLYNLIAMAFNNK